MHTQRMLVAACPVTVNLIVPFVVSRPTAMVQVDAPASANGEVFVGVPTNAIVPADVPFLTRPVNAQLFVFPAETVDTVPTT